MPYKKHKLFQFFAECNTISFPYALNLMSVLEITCQAQASIHSLHSIYYPSGATDLATKKSLLLYILHKELSEIIDNQKFLVTQIGLSGAGERDSGLVLQCEIIRLIMEISIILNYFQLQTSIFSLRLTSKYI